MRRIRTALLALVIVPAVSSLTIADTQPNPYLSVVERNPFGLKDPPPPPPETPPQPVVPLAKVALTGIITTFGPPRVFVEITEQEPGKPANVKKPILREGEREGSVEILSIDVANNSIRIRNGSVETNITFEVAKATSGAGPGAATIVPSMSTAAAQMAHPGGAAGAGSPTIISPGGASAPGRAGTGVSLFGGASPAVPSPTSNPGYSPTAYASVGNSGSAYSPASSLGNNLSAGVSTYGAGAGISRPLRTDSNYQPPMTSEQSHTTLRAATESVRRPGFVPPPVPPMPGEQAPPPVPGGTQPGAIH